MPKLKVGIIGTGFIGPVHVEAVRRLGWADIAAIAGSSQAGAEQKARELGIPNAYGDYRHIVEDPTIDVIHNCTPNYLHYGINREIIRAGKHVLSEKPLAMTSEECASLLQLAKEYDVVHAVNFNYRAYSMVQQVKASISSGQLGKINLVHGGYLQDWLLYETDYNWRLEERYGGKMRAVADIGSHWVDLIQYVTGQRMTSVFADLTTVIPVRKKPKDKSQTFQSASSDQAAYEDVPISTEDCAAVMFRMNGGAFGMFIVSQVSAGRKNRLSFEVNGSKTSAYWNQEQPEQLWIGHRDRPDELLMADPSLVDPQVKPFVHYPSGHNEGWADSVRNTMQTFYRTVLDRKDSESTKHDFATFADGYHCVRVTEAILHSSRTQSWVDIGDKED
ncbi:Gfo/Idh/MocA family oxidoreductase [Aneurinibacillus sp. Ricciae_BoGa-3]|uniref:Gfo/Idh/MocA family protein n=1 Tax=Aneurinibacillus sp. Ricciae_BoGa-3 TaxID=3022697 RepID=UPI002340C358|nr:Gfo/Idh/MocA family oxidoreductase [Aneurinibacillus sp. Ricciae_BoGa-3]WCK54709.1 Gfo/Idh/MocA family oxidoreductase [Aneurinibacillus sp. Ricciae_BoGa-3]